MEEKKQAQRLSYEKLNELAKELGINYQKLQQAYEGLKKRYDEALEALDDRAFQYNAFFLDRLFKVVEHPEMYKPEFVDWCVNNISASLVSFSKAGEQEAKEENKEKNEENAAE